MVSRLRHKKFCASLLAVTLLSLNAYVLLAVVVNQRGQSNIADQVVLFVRTSHNCLSRLNYLLQSWISTSILEQTNFYLITDRIPVNSNRTILNPFRNIVQTKCPPTHDVRDLCCKTAHEFQHFYNLKKIKPDLKWMCRFDDDQYVNIDNLYKYLSAIDSSKSYYIGRTSINRRLKIHNSSRTYSFATYGAGVCFSYTLLEKLRPHVHTNILSHGCIQRGIADDAYIGYVIESILNVSLTSVNDLFHSHMEKLDISFRNFSLDDLSRSITLGFAWDRYKLDWLPIVHRLIQLVNQGQLETANYFWLFLRTYEKEHPENLTDKYDNSCLSYQRLRSSSTSSPKKSSQKPARNRIKDNQYYEI